MQASAHEIALVERLQSKVRRHKRAIADHKEQLHAAAAELRTFEETLQRRGIELVLVQKPHGVGDIHGHRDSTRS